jgi:hypothetical protein
VSVTVLLCFLSSAAFAARFACPAANTEHLAATMKQHPEAFAVSLCAAMRVMCAATCSRTSPQAADVAAGSVLSLLPVELSTALPPEVQLAMVEQVISAALSAMCESKIAMAAPLPELGGSNGGSNSGSSGSSS